MAKALNSINSLRHCLQQFHRDGTVTTIMNNLVHHIFVDAFTDVSILQDVIENYLDQIQDRIIAVTSLNHHLSLDLIPWTSFILCHLPLILRMMRHTLFL